MQNQIGAANYAAPGNICLLHIEMDLGNVLAIVLTSSQTNKANEFAVRQTQQESFESVAHAVAEFAESNWDRSSYKTLSRCRSRALSLSLTLSLAASFDFCRKQINFGSPSGFSFAAHLFLFFFAFLM